MEQDISNIVRQYRHKLLADPYRPGYHFAIPDDDGWPGDSNGAFYADGRYHLMYLYRNTAAKAYHWGHLSSVDLLHWREHPDALTGFEGDEGCFSGGAFVDDDGTAYLTFWKFAAKDPGKDKSGIGMACAKPPYDVWQRMEPIAINATEWGITDMEIDGQTVHVCCADPSNIWKIGNDYYMQTGNLIILNKYGRAEDSPEELQGDWTDLFRSTDLKNWEYVHRFYKNTHAGPDWPDRTEDDMCPSFLPLYDAQSGGNPTGKWLQLFIAHNKGCQYYVGTLENETFYPEAHGRMSWNDKAYFAPEALVDNKNRQLAWVWLKDNPTDEKKRFDWTGVFGFPRNLWWEKDQLHMAPAEELDWLQYNHQGFPACVSEDGKAVPVKNGQSFRLKATIDPKQTKQVGFRIRANSAGTEYTDIYVDTAQNELVMDATRSGCDGWQIKEQGPFMLEEGEDIQLDIFVDKSVVEIYVNHCQAICRRVYPTDPTDAVGVSIIGTGAEIKNLDAWEMAPTNLY